MMPKPRQPCRGGRGAAAKARSPRIARSRARFRPASLPFLQAEDGIRDLYVTGVQKCALPISQAFSWLLAPTECLCSLHTLEKDTAGEIGRASCRERGEISVVAVSLKKTK